MEHQILHIKKQSIRKIVKRDCYIKNADATKIQNIQKIQNKISKSNVPGKFWKTNKMSKKKVQRKPCLTNRI